MVTPTAAAFLLGFVVPNASASAFLPPAGKIFAGETGQPISQYVGAVGRHPAVYQEFLGLSTFYGAYSGKPFVFAEFALWNSGGDVGFIDRLLGWAGSHPRVRMMLYNQGVSTSGPFRLYRYPNSSRELRRLLANPKFLAYAPEWAH